ncbi:MAG: acyl carrier protein [Mesorhizobium sp.]
MDVSSTDRNDIRRRVIELLQAEIQDKALVLTMETPIEQVVIDSIDIVRVLIKMEEEFGRETSFAPTGDYKTVGDVVDALIDLFMEPAPERSVR